MQVDPEKQLNPKDNEVDIPTLIANHEERLLHAEHAIGVLESRMPKGKWRRTLWYVNVTIAFVAPIVGVYGTLFVGDPLGRLLAVTTFGMLIGASTVNYGALLAKGPKPHRSLVIPDWR